jgi:hypothetical protein
MSALPVAVRLAQLEGVVERGLATFVEVGEALLEIRESRLYRESHATFEDYCRARWGFSRQWAHELIQASSVSSMLDVAPTSVRQAAELSPLRDEPEQMREAWQTAQTAGNGKPTATIVRQAVADVVQRNETARRQFLDSPAPPPTERPTYADGDWQALIGAAHRLLREIPSLGTPDDVVALIQSPPRPIGDSGRFIAAARDAERWIAAFIDQWETQP